MAVARDRVVALLEVEVVEAKDLPKMDMLGKVDPFCTLSFGGDRLWKTEVKKKTYTPVWNASFRILVLQSQSSYSLEFSLWDWDQHSKNDIIGSASLDVAPLIKDLKQRDCWLNLKNEKKSGSLGSVHVKVQCRDTKSVEKEFWNGFAAYFDRDDSKTISFLEFCAMCEGLGVSASNEVVSNLFASGKLDSDNCLNFSDLAALMSLENRDTNPLLGDVLSEETIDKMWKSMALLNDPSVSVGDLMLSSGFSGQIQKGKDKGDRDTILVHNRSTGKLEQELIPDYIRISLRMMYSTGTGRFAVNDLQLKKMLKHLSEQQGKKYSSAASKKHIQEFIDFHSLNVNEMLDPMESFSCFNEFFFRKLKSTARPIASPSEPKIITAPADARLNVFTSIDKAKELWIKGKNFTLFNLLQDSALTKKFDGGSLMISRLAPQDYHRFHSPIDATIGPFWQFDGSYFTVNPIAVKQPVDVFTENKRSRLVLHSLVFGDVIYIAVGATLVGGIYWTVKEGDKVKKGQELGYFAFGGSTILTIFQKNTVKFDEDLVVNSNKPLETLVQMGERVGERIE